MTSAFCWCNFDIIYAVAMKKLLLLILFWNVCLISYSQIVYQDVEGGDSIISYGQGSIVVYLSVDQYDEDPSDFYSRLTVNCMTYCKEVKYLHRKSGSIFSGSTYKWGPIFNAIFSESTMIRGKDKNMSDSQYEGFYGAKRNEKTVDSLFQNLYDWIKEIEDFALNHARHGVSYKMNYHNVYDSSRRRDYYLEAHRSYIKISTEKFWADMYLADCERWAKMNLKDITEFKKRLLEYTKEHNISIRL